MRELSTSVKYPAGMRNSTERIDRLSAHVRIRSKVKIVPMIKPSGRSRQLSASV
jgi:hypothetical protein